MRVVTVVDRLEITVGIDGEPRPLTEAIVSDLRTNEGFPEIQACERAEILSASVAREIQRRAQLADDTGTTANLTIIGITSNIVAGFCHVLQTDQPSIVDAKRQRSQVNALANAIRSLSFAQFEKFGARILTEIGASSSQITPHSGDQGIDFYGNLSLGKFQTVPLPFVKLTHDVVLAFMGQAKHYPTRSLGPDVVRELIGAVSLARTKTFSSDNVDLFPGLQLKPFSPVVIFLFTTGKLSKGAAQLADSSGMIARSGDQLATFLADKGIGMTAAAGGSAFDQTMFEVWLNA